MSITHKTAFAAFGCAVAMLSVSAHAVALAGGDNVSFSIDSPLGLFGSANVVGNSLELRPNVVDSVTGKTDFIATGATLSAYQTVNITVTALSGYQLTGFNLSESGGFAGSNLANAWIAGDLKAIDIEGDTGIAGHMNQQIVSSIAGSGLAAGSGNWTGSAAIALPVTGWGGSDGIVTSVTLTLTNDLIALDSAEIWKSLATVTATVSPVPEAETYAMMLAGLGLVAFMARRRNRAAV